MADSLGWFKNWKKKPLQNDPVNTGLTARKALEWELRPPPPPPPAQTQKVPAASSSHGSVASQQIPAAGSKSWSEHPHEVKDKELSFQAHLHMITTAPYGVDRGELASSAQPASRKPSPMSLKDIMAGKKR